MLKFKYKKLPLNDMCFFVLLIFSLVIAFMFQGVISRYESKPIKYDSEQKIEVVPIVSAKVNRTGFVKKEDLKVKEKVKEKSIHKTKPTAHKKKPVYDYGVDQQVDDLFVEFDDITTEDAADKSLVDRFDDEIEVAENEDTNWNEIHKDALDDFESIDVAAPKSHRQDTPDSQLKRDLESAKAGDAHEEIQSFFSRIKNEIVMRVSMYSDFKGSVTISLKLEAGKIVSATYSNSDRNFKNKLDELILNYSIKTPYTGIIKQVVVVK
ncbi:hypothetical protein ACNZ70_001716 [Vibrio mimicus]